MIRPASDFAGETLSQTWLVCRHVSPAEAYRQERAIILFLRLYSAPLFLLASLLLGGASAAGIVANAVLQLAAIALIIAILASDAPPPLSRPVRALFWLAGLGALLIAAQLIPLPPTIWSQLPGRATVIHAFDLAGVEPGWQPISLTPDATIAALLSFLPVVAMALATLASTETGRRYAVWTLIGAAIASVLLGAAQVTGGANSPLYPYAITNRGSSVGLFANRNHLGTFLLCTMPFLPAALPRRGGERGRGRRWVVAGLVALLGGGAVLTGSVASMALFIPVLAGCWLVAFPPRRSRLLRAGDVAMLVLLLLVAVAAIWRFAPIPHRGDPQHRIAITPLTLQATLDFMPLGSGGGSFRQIYPAYEDREAASPEYINHAHDDYLEIALEYGAPGAFLVIGAIAMWSGRLRSLWTTAGDGQVLARAGSVTLAVVLLHSMVDYPARTAAVAVIAAFAAMLMAAPSGLAEHAIPRRSRRKRLRSDSLVVMIDEL